MVQRRKKPTNEQDFVDGADSHKPLESLDKNAKRDFQIVPPIKLNEYEARILLSLQNKTGRNRSDAIRYAMLFTEAKFKEDF